MLHGPSSSTPHAGSSPQQQLRVEVQLSGGGTSVPLPADLPGKSAYGSASYFLSHPWSCRCVREGALVRAGVRTLLPWSCLQDVCLLPPAPPMQWQVSAGACAGARARSPAMELQDASILLPVPPLQR